MEQTNFSRNMHLNWNTLLLEALVLAIFQLVQCSSGLSRFLQMQSFWFLHHIRSLRGHHRYHYNHQLHFYMALKELACRWFLWLKIWYNLFKLITWVSEILELICIRILLLGLKSSSLAFDFVVCIALVVSVDESTI